MSSLEQWILMTNLDMSGSTDHNSDTDKMTTTKNSLTSTKLSECLVLLATLHKTKCLQYEHRHNMSIVITDH